ncbi:Basement membrane-specific heparan sulfate proteoglycan core protein [Porites harrisoni]
MESVVTGPSNRYHITYGRQTEIAESNLNKIFTTTAASLSLIGALLIIITFIMWPDLRTNSRRMIMFISIGDFSVALFNIIGIYNPSSDNEICRMQSLVTNVAILSSFMWTLNLSFYFYLTICRKISAEYERRIMQLLHLIGWGIPILIGIIAFTMGAYGFSRNVLTPGWCWISENQKWWKVVMWMFITGKGWEIMSYICIFKFYLLVILQIRREVRLGFIPGGDFLTPKALEVIKRAERKLTIIPMVFILLRIWGTIRFFRFLYYLPEDPPAIEFLLFLQGIGDSSQGFANFVLFCLLTDHVREKFRLCVVKFTPWYNYLEKDPLFESTNFPLNETTDFGSNTYGAAAGDCISVKSMN